MDRHSTATANFLLSVKTMTAPEQLPKKLGKKNIKHKGLKIKKIIIRNPFASS